MFLERLRCLSCSLCVGPHTAIAPLTPPPRVFAPCADEVQELELKADIEGLDALLEFLSCSFMGGTDVDAPLKLSLERLAQVRRGRGGVAAGGWGSSGAGAGRGSAGRGGDRWRTAKMLHTGTCRLSGLPAPVHAQTNPQPPFRTLWRTGLSLLGIALSTLGNCVGPHRLECNTKCPKRGNPAFPF